MSAKKIIAVDVDDVIAAEAKFIVDYSNTHWGYTLTLDDYREDWMGMWGVEYEEAERRVDELHAPGIESSYDFIAGGKEVLSKLCQRYNLIVLTSRRKEVQAETLTWFEREFPGVFTGIHFTGFHDSGQPGGHLLTKGELAKEIGADYIIDDQPKHCFAAAEAGIEALLFGDYGVSRGLELPERVTRCHDWAAVQRYFDEKDN